jgi:hypothetical protein
MVLQFETLIGVVFKLHRLILDDFHPARAAGRTRLRIYMYEILQFWSKLDPRQRRNRSDLTGDSTGDQ